MTAKSYEYAWLAYAVGNRRASEDYRSRMRRRHRAYTERTHRAIAAGRWPW
jgi:hypothetical protein